MRKKLLPIKVIAAVLTCVATFICFFCMYFAPKSIKAEREGTMLSVWQIDGFEGGKGSRADFLQKAGKKFSSSENCYITVTALSADAARLNLAMNIVPDVISFGAGMYGIEGYIRDFKVWCRGSYCILTLDTATDFSDVNSRNTVINGGKDNFALAAALFCGVNGSREESPTNAYLQLINGNYKYLLGTQRDIFRLKTRGVAFSAKAVTAFNDLYQVVAVTTKSRNVAYAQRYIDYLLDRKTELSKIGMLFDGVKLYDDEMRKLENISFERKITYPINGVTREKIQKSLESDDINMLKELIK